MELASATKKILSNRKKKCPVCNDNFVTFLGHRDEKTVCSIGCSNTFFTAKRHTKESNQKTSESVEKYFLSIGKNRKTRNMVCYICGKKKLTYKQNQKCCSNKCASQLRSRNPEYIQKLRDAQRKLVLEGRHSGWKSRNILSYPEKFFIRVLNNNGILFRVNKPFLGYFLDFALEDKMIDLEIDGKQHKYPDRKENDVLRDKTLSENGWKVYRIDWNGINTLIGKQMMKEKIDKFLEVYKQS